MCVRVWTLHLSKAKSLLFLCSQVRNPYISTSFFFPPITTKTGLDQTSVTEWYTSSDNLLSGKLFSRSEAASFIQFRGSSWPEAAGRRNA